MKKICIFTLFTLFSVGEIFSQTVTIGSQVWMTSNLDVSTFRNGEPIPEAKNSQEWIDKCKNKQSAFCYYNFDSKMGIIFGKLYNYYAISDSRGLAPIGFSVPTKDDWVTLWNTLCNYNDYVKLNGELKKDAENFKTWHNFRKMVAIKICVGPKFETKVSYIEHGGYEETKWVSCNNCSYWTAEQKKNNPCTVCRNQRGWYNKTGKYISKTQEKIEKTNQLYGAQGCTNESGFSARSGGYVSVSNEGSTYFNGIYISDIYWSRTQEYRNSDGEYYSEGLGVYLFNLMNKKSDSPYVTDDYHYANVDLESQFDDAGFYVRCLKD